MSAICGIYRPGDKIVPLEELENMLQSMSHRGPDRSSVVVLGNIGMGQAMLCTTPESLNEYQPYKEGSIAIVADARIDNRDDLQRTLELPRNATDCQIILNAYRRWKENCPQELLGDYSFAIWDDETGRLFCARDHMGVRPFYYYRSEKTFAFASEIKALMQLPDVPRTLNEKMVENYLAIELDDREITFYRGIKRLPAACSMLHPQEPKRYWQLDPTRKIRHSSDQEYAAEFLRVFGEAVRCRIRSPCSVGSTLSGGLDSSSVCCLASLVLSNQGRQLETFSAVFPDAPECDETFYIKEVLSKGNMNPHYIRADLVSPLQDIEKVFEELDEPYWFPNLFWIRAICQSANQANVRVLLDGFDGDTVVSHGLFLLEEAFRSFHWGRLLAEISCLQKTLKIPAKNLIWTRCIVPLAPDWFARIWKRIRKHTAYDYAKPNFNPHFAKKIGLRSGLQAKYESRAGSPSNELLEALEDGFLQYIMEAESHIAAAFSLEYSHPFFDKRVVEFSLALPSDQRLRRGYSRWIMREALKEILPEKIRMRGDKANLSSNFDQRLIFEDRDILRSLAANNCHDVWRYASYSQFKNIHEQIRSDPSKLNTLSLWAMANLALWLEKIQIKIDLKI